MHIVLRNGRRETLFRVEVDLTSPPTIVHPPSGGGTAVHLDWDRALDDEHHLRHCPVCGCRHLFARKQLPQLTGFALIVLAAIIATGLYAGEQTVAAVLVLMVVVALDLGIFLFARRELVCYLCRSSFHDMPIRRGHPRWQRTLGQRYARAEPPKLRRPPRGENAATVDESAAAPEPQRSRAD